MKEQELRELVESIRPKKTILWGDGLGVLLFWMFAFLPYAVLEKEAHDLMHLWTLLLAGVGLVCFARFSAALTLRNQIDSGLAKIDGLPDPHGKSREFWQQDLLQLIKKKGAQS